MTSTYTFSFVVLHEKQTCSTKEVCCLWFLMVNLSTSRWGFWWSVGLQSCSQVASTVKFLPIHICADWLNKISSLFLHICLWRTISRRVLHLPSEPQYLMPGHDMLLLEAQGCLLLSQGHHRSGVGLQAHALQVTLTGNTRTGCTPKSYKWLKHSPHPRVMVKLLWLSPKCQFWPHQHSCRREWGSWECTHLCLPITSIGWSHQ